MFNISSIEFKKGYVSRCLHEESKHIKQTINITVFFIFTASTAFPKTFLSNPNKYMRLFATVNISSFRVCRYKPADRSLPQRLIQSNATSRDFLFNSNLFF